MTYICFKYHRKKKHSILESAYTNYSKGNDHIKFTRLDRQTTVSVHHCEPVIPKPKDPKQCKWKENI